MLYANGDALNPDLVADDFALTTPGKYSMAFVFKTDGPERFIWDKRGNGASQSRDTMVLQKETNLMPKEVMRN